MHSLLALTLTHDRYLRGRSNQNQAAREAFHQYQSIALFNARLARPIQPSPTESAALFVTAIFLGTMTFCNLEAGTPYEAWPLKPTSPSDLSWLTMSEGKTKLWKMTQSFASEARFQGLLPPKGIIPKTSMPSELSVLPKELIELCGLNAVADHSNPYHAVAATFAKAIQIDYLSMLLSFMCLISNIPEEYKKLLRKKDSRALLLLGLWYSKLCEIDLWWIKPRASLEGHAICIYLRQYCQGDAELQALMRLLWNDWLPSKRCSAELA